MKKTLLRLMALCLTALTIGSLSPAPALAESYQATINKDKVFFRSKPDTDSVYFGKLDKGTRITIIGASGKFYKVEYKDKTGYIMKSLVNAPSKAKEAYEPEVKSKYDSVKSISGLGSAPKSTRKGASGDAVEKLQRALQIKGYLKGNVDGKYGDMTVDAVKRFQKAEKLSVTGDANTATIAKLFGLKTETSVKNDPGMDGITSIRKIDVPNTTKPGNSGRHVKALQQALKIKGYYKSEIDSSYGEATQEAVKRYQRSVGIKADGIAGNATIKRLFGQNAANYQEPTKRLDWRSNDGLIPKGATITIKDIASGLTFRAKRWSGYNHLDAEPLSSEDAAIMKKIGGGVYSWNRRAILVKYDGVVYAASMNTMPHEEKTISGNNYDGHFCIHFYKSKTHGSNKIDAAHQNAVERAMDNTW